MSEAAAKKDIQKLQRAIVDGLEDVKAQDIRVYNTEHLSPLFERVVVASGTSNRQTKALAASVREKVREGGFAKPRVEGEENGEWIIVDCGPAVAHIMQPAIRQYYQLEEIWGEKPVRLKFGSPKPATPAPRARAAKSEEKKASPQAGEGKSATKKVAKKKLPARAAAGEARPARPAAKSSAPRGAASRAAPARPRRRAPESATMQTVVVNAPAAAARKTAAAKMPGKAPAKAPARKKPAARAGR